VAARNDKGLLITAATLVVIVDQVTKSIVTATLGPDSQISHLDIAGNWFAIAYVENRGAAFGLFGEVSSLLPLIGIALVVALLVHYRTERNPPRIQVLAVGAVVGGAIGNLIDRLRLGYVVDFISIGPWPNFNVADSAVTVGVLVLIWTWMKVGQRHELTRPH
jgi:signal peptidase II